jgi:uncharacterized protein (TIRG00374 family)
MTSERRSPIRYWPLALGVLVTAGVAWFAAREFDWRAVWASLVRADLRYVALAMAAMLLNILLKVWRWQWLFHPQIGTPSRVPGTPPRVLGEVGGTGQLRRRDLLSALMIGQLGNVLLPTRLGDVARMGVVHKKAGVALSWALLTLVAEKALDSVMLLVLLGALLPFVAWPTWMSTTQLVFGTLLAAGLIGLVWLATQATVRHRLAQVLQRLLPGPIPRWTERILESLSAWRAVQERAVQVRLWTLSVLIWLLAGLVNHFGFCAVGLHLPLTAGLLLAATEIAGTRLAYTPAAIGIYHSIAIVTLAPFGVGPTDALSAALLLHLVVYLPILIGGLAAVWWEGLAGIA